MASLTRAGGGRESSLEGSDDVNIVSMSGFHLPWMYGDLSSLILVSKSGYPIVSSAQSIIRCQADRSLSNEPAKFSE